MRVHTRIDRLIVSYGPRVQHKQREKPMCTLVRTTSLNQDPFVRPRLLVPCRAMSLSCHASEMPHRATRCDHALDSGLAAKGCLTSYQQILAAKPAPAAPKKLLTVSTRTPSLADNVVQAPDKRFVLEGQASLQQLPARSKQAPKSDWLPPNKLFEVRDKLQTATYSLKLPPTKLLISS